MLNWSPFLRRHIVLYDDDVEATCKDFYGEELNEMKNDARLKTKKNYNF